MRRTPPSTNPVLFPQPLARRRRTWLFVFPLAAGFVVATWWPRSEAGGVDHSKPAIATGTMSQLLLSKGIGAYDEHSYESASTFLRRALAVKGTDSLDTPRRARALTYLAATEVSRGRRDSGVAVFRQLLQESPRRMPDSLIFPPHVMSVYHGVRASLHGVARVRTTESGVDLIVVAFTPHRLGVGVRVHDGEPLRELFDGVVSDSVVVPWDGRKEDGSMAPSGDYDFVLIAFGPKGDVEKAVRFPVVLNRKDITRPPRPRSVDSPLQPVTRLGDAVLSLPQPSH